MCYGHLKNYQKPRKVQKPNGNIWRLHISIKKIKIISLFGKHILFEQLATIPIHIAVIVFCVRPNNQTKTPNVLASPAYPILFFVHIIKEKVFRKGVSSSWQADAIVVKKEGTRNV